MAVYFAPVKLKSLTQGSRIAFIRQLRHMSQQVFGEKIGMSPEHLRSRICRYEKHDRDIKPDRLKKMAEVLDVNIKMIERWDFRDPEQLYYEMLWIEELCPGISIKKYGMEILENETHKTLLIMYPEWKRMRLRYEKGEITYDEYLEWKLGSYKETEDTR